MGFVAPLTLVGRHVRLGARQDGILRNHQILPDGTLRDTVVFSIVAGEWPAVKRHLAFELERPRGFKRC